MLLQFFLFLNSHKTIRYKENQTKCRGLKTGERNNKIYRDYPEVAVFEKNNQLLNII